MKQAAPVLLVTEANEERHGGRSRDVTAVAAGDDAASGEPAASRRPTTLATTTASGSSAIAADPVIGALGLVAGGFTFAHMRTLSAHTR
jgi:hypothetical protein